jgi:HNH endonuclease
VRSGPRGDGLVWTPETILYALHLWVRRHGRPPAAREWDRAGEDHPSRQTVQRVFGRWNRAIHAAGHPPRRPGERRERHSAGLRDANGRFLSPQSETA